MRTPATILLLLTILLPAPMSHSQIPSPMDTSFSEMLVKDKWVSDAIVGLNPRTKTYKLTRYAPKGKFAGNITTFSEDSVFHSHYTSWCGNDYFTTVSGKYKFLDGNKIAIAVETVSYSGEWTKPTEQRKTNYVAFAISIVGDTLVLTRQGTQRK